MDVGCCSAAEQMRATAITRTSAANTAADDNRVDVDTPCVHPPLVVDPILVGERELPLFSTAFINLDYG